MNGSPKQYLLLFCASFLVTSCKPFVQGVLINATPQKLHVCLIDATDGKVHEGFFLDPEEKRATMYGIVSRRIVTCNFDTNKPLFTQLLPEPKDPQQKYYTPKEPIHYLIDEERVYVLPRKYRNNWKEHLEEIKAEQLSLSEESKAEKEKGINSTSDLPFPRGGVRP